MTPLCFYREQAVLQEAAATAAQLPQVRDRCLRAASAWKVLAERAQKTEDARVLKAEQEHERVVARSAQAEQDLV